MACDSTSVFLSAHAVRCVADISLLVIKAVAYICARLVDLGKDLHRRHVRTADGES